MEGTVVRGDERILVWDLPTRLFHWLFAGGFITAFAISQLADEEGALFPYHAIVGLCLALLVVLRLAWGVIGSRYSRFTSFSLSPASVLTYFRDMLVGGGRRHIGHNPASSVAIVAMLLLMLGLGATGFMLGRGNEGMKEAHEVLAYAMAAVAGAHILGVALHTLRHRENITRSMITGVKFGPPGEGIRSGQPLAALVLVGLVGAWSVAVVRNYDAAKRTATLPLLGASLQLAGESEGEDDASPRGNNNREDDDDD